MEIMNGVPVVCVEGLIRMKKKLGREKDLADIVLIEKAKKPDNANQSEEPVKPFIINV